MLPDRIRLFSSTTENRHAMIDYASRSISKRSGWIKNHTMYSNAMIVINFEIEAKDVKELLGDLNQEGMKLFQESLELAAAFPEEVQNGEKEISGSLRITFIHNDPDMRIPSVPG
ncbi:hypothetical protein GKZ89_09010 [Bacillus mangrovi]|uniref:Uncharacterized protein n=1 Tax=Metabacillus mangrovi TaxID=1491830 RepID=A0A7X2S4U4_9BACI|nr:hypothetical protein [Metabacillus mangrovi]MTH53540.1 hypothetical protein [Metabacillus mangrovi]